MNNWYKIALALDPNAYSYEETPSRLGEDMEIQRTPYGKVFQPQNPEEIESKYKGVHFTPSEELAAVYACGKATKEDPPVIIELSPQDMQKELDVDGMVNQGVNGYFDGRKSDFQEILNSNEEIEMKADKIANILQDDSDYWESQNETSDTTDFVVQQAQGVAPSVMRNYFSEKDDTQIVSGMMGMLNGDIPKELHMELVAQFRVLQPVGNDRVKAIYQIPWIDFSHDPNTNIERDDEEAMQEEGYHMEGDDIVNENGQIVLDYEDLEGGWLSKTPLYQNKQLYLPGQEMSEESVWHGTTLSRAKQAYPELLGVNIQASFNLKNYKLAKEQRQHSYSWVFLKLPDDIKKEMRSFGKEIDKDDLYEKEADNGLELDPHITVKYGLLTEDNKDAKDIIDEEKGGSVYLGKSSIFENDDFDVVKIDVESEDLERLHNKLNALPHEDKHPEFHAHATIAYVKKGTGKKYVDKFKIDKSFKFKEVFFGDKEENHNKIKLGFNLKKFVKAQIWNFVDDVHPVDGEKDYVSEFESLLKMMYEMEYKYSMLKSRPFSGNEVRRENITNKVREVLDEACDQIISQLKETIGKWLKSHALTEPQEWATERVSGIEDGSYNSKEAGEMMIYEYEKWRLSNGRGSNKVYLDLSPADKERIFSQMLDQAYRNLGSFPSLASYLREIFAEYQNSFYDYSLKEINEMLNKKFRNNKQAQDFVSNMKMEDIDPESYSYFSLDTFGEMDDGTIERILPEFYAYFVFPVWFQYWSAQGIEETREKIEAAFSDLKNAQSVEDKIAVISQALNLYHQNGKMLEYLEGDVGSSNLEETLTNLTEGKVFVEKANKELMEVGVQMEQPAQPEQAMSANQKLVEKRKKEAVMANSSLIKDFKPVLSNNSISISNWYKASSASVVKGRPVWKPYRLVKIVNDVEQPISQLKEAREYAVNPEQARTKFLLKYGWLKDYVSAGMVIEARFDKELFDREQIEKAQKAEKAKEYKEEKADQIKEMWWNKD